MRQWTFEELHAENEKNALGLQYTIAERERLKAILTLLSEQTTKKNATEVAVLMKCVIESPSERMQDIFALLANGIKKNGFFVEFGACDGVAANNTLMLEKYFGWTGILGEPSTFWHSRLHENRTARIDERCVSSRTGGTLKLFESERPGNSSTERDHAYLGAVVNSYDVDTVSLLDLLKDHDAPQYIDFISIDTEGHEMDVLRKFDFDRFRFGFLTIEQHAQVLPENDIRPLLKDAGYTVVFPREEGEPLALQVTGYDLFFVPKNHPWAKLYNEPWKPRYQDVEEERSAASQTSAHYGGTEIQGAASEGASKRGTSKDDIVALTQAIVEKDRQFNELQEQLTQSEASARKLIDRLDSLWLELRAAEAKQRDAESSAQTTEAALAQRYQEIAILTSLLDKQEEETGKAVEHIAKLSDEVTALSERLREEEEKRSQEVSSLEARLREQEEKKSEEIGSLEARLREEKRDKALVVDQRSKLTKELDELSERLREQQQESAALTEHIEWLVSLHKTIADRPGWWRMLPKNSTQRMEQEQLEEKGIFDARAYLERYLDVAEAGWDPLDHYLQHGMLEGRSR